MRVDTHMHLALVELLLQGGRFHPHHGGAAFGVFLGHYHFLNGLSD
jgi:hypothetical protein